MRDEQAEQALEGSLEADRMVDDRRERELAERAVNRGREGPRRSIRPFAQTRTRRRERRTELRNTLGVSHDDPPTLAALVRAARLLDALMVDTSAGRYRVRVTHLGAPVSGHDLSLALRAWREDN